MKKIELYKRIINSTKMSGQSITGSYTSPLAKHFNENTPYDTLAMKCFRDKVAETFGNSLKFTVAQVDTIAVSPFGVLGAAKAGLGYMRAKILYNQVRNPTTNELMEVPGLAFIRGDSGAVLTFLRSRGIDYVVMTEQARVPICDPAFREIPAGMLNDAKGMRGFAAAVAAEMREEVGLDLDMEEDLKPLGYSFLSPGGSDEGMRLFFTRVQCNADVIEHLKDKLNGLLEENELITVRILPLKNVRAQIKSGELKDAKLILALSYYDNARELHSWACKRELKMIENKPIMCRIPPSYWETIVSWFSKKAVTLTTNEPVLATIPIKITIK